MRHPSSNHRNRHLPLARASADTGPGRGRHPWQWWRAVAAGTLLLELLCGCDVGASSTPSAASGPIEAVASEGGKSVVSSPAPPAAPGPASAARFVPLTLASAPPAASIPVRSGIPFPPAAVRSVANLRLESADGAQEVPAQFDLLSAWPDGSVKSALAQFVSDVGAARHYRIAYGADVGRAGAPAGIRVTTTGDGTTVDTGAIKFIVERHGLVAALWRDADHDGRYSAAEQVLGGGEFFMANALDDQEYVASATKDASVAIEESGPVRVVLRARGSLVNGAGVKLLRYQVRYYAYAGSDKLDIDYTVIDDRLEADVEKAGQTLAVSVKGYGLRWKYLGDAASGYRFGIDESGHAASGTLGGEHYLLQNGSFVFDNGENKGSVFKFSGAASGLRAPGWLALDSASRHLVLMVRDFWQQYPAELAVNDQQIRVSLFAERAVTPAASTVVPIQHGTTYRRPNTFYFLRPGGAKTHQLRLAFDAASPSEASIAALNAGYQRHRLELTAPPSWYASSGVFGDIDVGEPYAPAGYSASLLHDVYIPSIESPRLESVLHGDPDDKGGDATMFGWRDYGDRLRAGWNSVSNGVRIPAFYNDTHVGANNFFHEFARTGEQRWFQLGEVSTRHFEDIDVAHGPRQGYWDRSHRGMGAQPAGEIHAISHANEDHQVRNMHWGHAHVSGLSDFYLLTGDKRSLEVLTEIADWWRFVTPRFFALPFNPSDYREAERDFAWPLYAMNEYVRVTGDAAYQKQVNAHLVNYLIQWWMTPLPHIGYDPKLRQTTAGVVNVNDAARGTGYWTMSLMDNDNGSRATGTNPWMAGPLLSSLIRFHQQDQQMSAAGKGSGVSPQVLEDMLLQCMNYVVKYGYDADKSRFVYSEVKRDGTGGHTLIDFPLAYLDQLYQTRLKEGALKHPGWYDTQPLWSAIARRDYDELMQAKVGANTQAYGFYGYEMVYPVDFFRLMSRK